MFNRIQGDNLLKTQLASNIATGSATTETEKSFSVGEAPDGDFGWVYLNFSDSTKREIIRFHRRSGTTLYYYDYNREDVTKSHDIGDFCQINTVTEYINYLSKNVDDFGFVEKTINPGLKVLVRGGRVNKPAEADVNISDTALTVTDDATNYIYFDYINETFDISATEVTNYPVMAKVIAVAGDITSITEYRSIYLDFGVVPSSYTTIERDALTDVRNGTFIYNTTDGEAQIYNGGTWYSIALGSTQPNASETVAGKVEKATDAEVTAGDETGGTGAYLFITPLQAKNLIQLAAKDYQDFTDQGSAPANPSAGVSRLYVDQTTGELYIKKPSGDNIPVLNINQLTETTEVDLANDEAIIYDSSTGANRKVKLSSLIGDFGDGSDGALTVASGTTNIDASSENVVVKNYSSINISAGATLGLTNKATDGTILILKCTGDATIAGTIDMQGMGADAGDNGYGLLFNSNNYFGGTASGTSTGASGGNKYEYNDIYSLDKYKTIGGKYILGCGSGGGTGSNGDDGSRTGPAGGPGGEGGGVVILLVGGDINFTGEIKVNGNNGNDGANNTSGDRGGGGGGGGGGSGMAVILYISQTAISGTITAKGGAGGDGGTSIGSDNGGGGGGGGGTYSEAGKDGGSGATGVGTGTNGGSSTTGAGAGGGGGAYNNTDKPNTTGGTSTGDDTDLYYIGQYI